MANRPKPVTFTSQETTDTAETQAPWPLKIIGTLPGAAISIPAASSATAGVVKEAAHVDPTSGTFAADLVASLIAAGIMAAS